MIILIGIIFLLTACETKPDSIPTVENTCIPPVDEFSYYAGLGTPYPEKSVVPPAPWTMEATIELRTPLLLGVRTLSSNVTELWFYEDFPLAGERDIHNQIYVFRTDKEELTPVVLDEIFLNSHSPIDEIYITEER